MKKLNSLNKNAMVLMMIAATGLPASMAAAQFKVEHSAKSEPAPESKTDHQVMIIQSNDDEHAYEIKIVNGQVTVAKLDGKDVDKKSIKVTDGVVIFIGEDGETLHELKLPEDKQHKTHTMKQGNVVWDSATHTRTRNSGDNEFIVDFASAPKTTKGNVLYTTGVVSQPKVMLGINLGEPSSILRKHLNLKDGIQAILVEKVIKGLPAALSGMQDFDVIVSIDGSDEANGKILGKILSEKEAGDVMKLVLIRGGEKMKLKIKLAQYDAHALQFPKVTGEYFIDDKDGAQNIQLDILTKLEDGEFGNLEAEHLARLKEELHKHLGNVNEHHELAIEMRAKAMDAMKDAERQIVEFRNGKLFVQSTKELHEHAEQLRDGLHEIHERLPDLNPEQLHQHLGGVENRLAELEDRLDRQFDEMSSQIDRLTSMFERLMNRLERNDD